MKKQTLQPEDFELETNTIWSFPKHGSWATHNSKYRGNWSPYIPRNVIIRYSAGGDTVLDQFVGGGTTAVEAKLTNRKFIGVDINPEAIAITKEKLDFPSSFTQEIKLYKSNATSLSMIENSSIDLICTHPPYADIINYSENIDGDLSLLQMDEFLIKMKDVAAECYRVLKEDKFCAVLMGDTRKKGMVQPLGFKVMQTFEASGFKTKEIIIKEQHNCKATGYWKKNSIKYNFLLLAHEYLFVFKKPGL